MNDKMEKLIRDLESNDLSVCNDASIALGDIGDISAVEPLFRLIKRESRAGYYAIQAIGQIGDKSAIEPLEVIAAEDEFLDTVARQAIKEIKDKEFVDANRYFHEGIDNENKGDTDQAIECYLKALEDNPRYSEVHFNLGNLYSQLGRSEEAVESYKRCLQYVDSPISSWVPYLYRAKKAINEAEGVDHDSSVNRLMEFLDKYKTEYNRPGGGDTSDIKDYVLCICDVKHLDTNEASEALKKVKANACYAEIAMTVEIATENNSN